MNVNPKDIQSLLEFVDEEWLMLLFRIICSGIAIALIINIVQSIAAYINLRLDPYLRKGSLLEFEGSECRVKAIKIFRVELEFKRGYMTVPTRRWSEEKYLILKDISAMQKIKHYHVQETLTHNEEQNDCSE